MRSRRNKAKATLVLSLIFVMLISSVSFAAQDGLYINDQYYSMDYLGTLSVEELTALYDLTQANADSSYVVLADQYAKFNDYDGPGSISGDSDTVVPGTVTDVATGENINSETGEVVDGALTVDSVSAITDYVPVTAGDDDDHPAVQLEFAINDETTAADVAALVEAGYTVEYATSNDTVVDEDGLFDNGGLIAGDTFKYQVIISDENGVVAESDLVTVTVADETVVVAATELALVASGATETWDLGYITMDNVASKDEKVSVVVTEGTNYDGTVIDENTGTDEYTQENIDAANTTYSSSNATVALINSSGEITPLKTGTTTITVAIGDNEKTMNLEVKETPEATSIVEDSVTLQASDTSFDVTLLDQYGEEMRQDATTTGWAIEIGSDTTDVIDASGAGFSVSASALTINSLSLTAGTDTLTVKNADGDVLGTINVEVVADATLADADSFEFVVATGSESDDFVIDLYDTDDDELTVAIDAMAGNVKVGDKVDADDIDTAFTDATWSFDSTDDDVFTVASDGTISWVGEGTAKVQLLQGSIVMEEETITVNNSTPQVTAMDLAEGVTEVSFSESATLKDFLDLFAVSAGDEDFTFDDDGQVTPDYTGIEIASIVDSEELITFSEGTEGTTAATFTMSDITADTDTTIVITFKTVYGEAQFVFDATVTAD